MGTHVNPDNDGFFQAINQQCYVDKTGLIAYFNSVLSSPDKKILFSRPRRFGKTTACSMLEAYYSVGADSEDLFKGLEIEKDTIFRGHLNKHPVISFDLLAFMDRWRKSQPAKGEEKPPLVQFIEKTSYMNSCRNILQRALARLRLILNQRFPKPCLLFLLFSKRKNAKKCLAQKTGLKPTFINSL